ncbi:MAG TPA: efflux RND transporter periplasmic adaptor subunit [Pseudomonadales bacterium]|jgi:HlyD family secretion protein|nr:efflux RND transporter periplasmic adaptor subunit [Gammaproteobacteria bacterium]HIL85600.1 efflux RND transporter periplasmic adaptor subunit [Pseudomonadales bacterium]
MKKLIAGIVVALAAVGLYVNSQRTAVVRVSVVQVARGDVIASVTNTRAGTVDACRRAGIAPATGGNITGLYVKDGDVVVKDQLLLELWNADLRARVLLAQQDAAASESMSRQSCVTAGVAKRVANRLVQLKKGGLASQEAVERAVGEAESAEAACKASRDVIKVRQAGVEVANATLLRTQLRAPFDGVIAEINGELGEWVTPSPVGIPTPPTVDLIDNSCLYIKAPIDEVDAPEVRAGMPAWITLDAFKDRRFAGTVRRVAPYVLDIEKQSRTVDVEAVINDPDMQVLLPGYSADVEVILDERHDVLYVPTSVVLEDSSVYLIPAGGGTLEKRQVGTGLENWEQTEIVSGLVEGDYLVRSVDREGVENGAAAQIDEP